MQMCQCTVFCCSSKTAEDIRFVSNVGVKCEVKERQGRKTYRILSISLLKHAINTCVWTQPQVCISRVHPPYICLGSGKFLVNVI